MNEIAITIAGNLVDDPELRYTPSGQPVARFRIASTPCQFDRQSGEWKDGDTLFLTVSVWRQAVENVAESLTRGTRAIVSGRFRQRSYETREGDKRTVYEIEADEVGPSLRNASAKVTRAARSSGAGNGGSQRQDQAEADPWGQRQVRQLLGRVSVLASPARSGRPGQGTGGRPLRHPGRRAPVTAISG